MTVEFDDYIGTMPTSKIANAVTERITTWNSGLHRNGMIQQLRRNYRLYYNVDPNTYGYQSWDSFSLGGDNGEYLKIRGNLFRNFIQHILNLMFAKPPAIKAVAGNSEGPSLDAALLFNSVVEDMFQTQKASRHIKKAGEYSLIFGTGFCTVEWDAMSGEDWIPKDDSTMMQQGGIRIRPRSPFDVFWDQGKEDWEDVNWVVVRESHNKFNLASQYPDMAEKILMVKSKDRQQGSMFIFDQMETDDIFVYKLFHKPINANFLPNGRYVIVAGDDCVLYDDVNPYDGIPVFRVAPMEGIGTCYGYTPANDIAPLQMLYNIVLTCVATQVSAHGAGDLVVQRGSDVTQSSLAGGRNVIEYAPGTQPPQALSLLTIPPELMQVPQLLSQLMEELTGINSVMRGNPNENLKSGRALAIVQSMAIQFMSGFQMSVVNFTEDIGNFTLKLLQKFATTDRMAQIVGENKIAESFAWNNETMMRIARVRAEVIDPFSQTVTGKLEKAEALLQAGMLTTPQEYLTLSETGNIDPLLKSPLSSLKRIREENRMLMNGQEPLILNTDPHEMEIAEHLTVLDTPQVRNNPQVAQTALNHIMKHQMALQGVQFDVLGNVLNGPQQIPPNQIPQGLPGPQQQQGPQQGGQPPQLSHIQGRPPVVGAQPLEPH